MKIFTVSTLLFISLFTNLTHSHKGHNHHTNDNKEWQTIGKHMRLINNLDREDGWCVDLVGSGQHVRFDMPLIGHNCKPDLFADEAVHFDKDGKIIFPAYGPACITVMGLNDNALVGAALMLKPCNQEIPFLKARNFQHFKHQENGTVQLKKSDLCITVGKESKSTFDPTHAWRTLYMEKCTKLDMKRATWQFINAG